jgi:hypothetical protein
MLVVNHIEAYNFSTAPRNIDRTLQVENTADRKALTKFVGAKGVRW